MSTSKKTVVEEYMEIFKKETIVEVSSEDQGLRGSWYTATVIRALSRVTREIQVEYHNLISESDSSKKLRESVDAVLIRPIPPLDPNPVFRVMEDVDAFHNDGWWEGVVTRVFDDASSGTRMYSVFFRCSREQIDFSPSDLRLHREWVRGNQWVPPLVNHSSAASSSSGPKRKNGDDSKDGRNGGYSAGGSGSGTRKGEGEGKGKTTRTSPRKQGGSGSGMRNVERGGEGKRTRTSLWKQGGSGGVVMKKQVGVNGKSSSISNRLVSNGVTARRNQSISSNGTVHSNGGVTRNGTLKEPRRRATSHRGHRISRK